MRLDIEVSDQADLDLQEIWEFIAQDSEAAADRLLLRIMETLEALAAQADMGRARADLGDDVRSFPATPNFGLFYSRTSSTLRLLRVMRFSRDINPSMFDD